MTRARKNYPWFHFSRKSITHIIFFIFFTSAIIYFINENRITLRYPIHEVKIAGVVHTNQLEIEHALIPYVSHGFFSVEVEAIKDRLAQIPWIAKVNVRRIWPNEVWINIIEKKAVANWNQASLLSADGDLFIPEKNSIPNDLPYFIGPEGKHIFMMEYYHRLNAILTPLHFKVARLEFSPGHLWYVTLSNSMKLTVNHKDFLTRFRHFVKVYPKVVGNRASEIDYVDLRYSNGLAVRWKTII